MFRRSVSDLNSDGELRKVTHCSCYYASCDDIFGNVNFKWMVMFLDDA